MNMFSNTSDPQNHKIYKALQRFPDKTGLLTALLPVQPFNMKHFGLWLAVLTGSAHPSSDSAAAVVCFRVSCSVSGSFSSSLARG